MDLQGDRCGRANYAHVHAEVSFDLSPKPRPRALILAFCCVQHMCLKKGCGPRLVTNLRRGLVACRKLLNGSISDTQRRRRTPAGKGQQQCAGADLSGCDDTSHEMGGRHHILHLARGEHTQHGSRCTTTPMMQTASLSAL